MKEKNNQKGWKVYKLKLMMMTMTDTKQSDSIKKAKYTSVKLYKYFIFCNKVVQ